MGNGEETTVGASGYFMRSGYQNDEDNLLLNYRELPKNPDGSLDLNSAQRLLSAYVENKAIAQIKL